MTNQANKFAIQAFWNALAKATPEETSKVCSDHLSPNFHWNGGDPFGQTFTPVDYARIFWEPLKRAIPDLARHTHIFMGGQSDANADGSHDGTMWVAGTGYSTGHAATPFLNIPTTEQKLRIRWGEFYRIDEGKITYCQMIVDFIDWFDQIGQPVLPKPTGALHVFPAPTGYNGELLTEQDAAITSKTRDFGRDFIFGGLNKFDENNLSSMAMAKFFHPNLKWYGPGGIGGCLSFTEFETFHQKPWLIAFPDRKVIHLESLFAEDLMLAASGPRGVIATHTGPYLGHPPSSASIEVSGIDFWLRSKCRNMENFVENWVFVDMIYLFQQMGVDLFGRLPKSKS